MTPTIIQDVVKDMKSTERIQRGRKSLKTNNEFAVDLAISQLSRSTRLQAGRPAVIHLT